MVNVMNWLCSPQDEKAKHITIAHIM